jgi:hypothetical protein
MAKYFIKDTTMRDIGDAIREKAGHSNTMTPAEMVEAIRNISTSSGDNYGGMVDTSDATATASDILKNKTAYVNGVKVTGTIPSLRGTVYIPSTNLQTINHGQYLAGDQSILGDTNLVSENIKAGTSIFTVPGSFTSDATATADKMLAGETAYVNGTKVTGTIQSKGTETITPTISDQTINSGVYLSGAQTIKGDANLLSENIKDGVTIFGVSGSYIPDAGVLPTPEYSIQSVNSWNASATADGYYQSYSTDGTYALCKISFNTKGVYDLYVDCVATGQQGGTVLLSNIDTSLTKSFNVDVANVYSRWDFAIATGSESRSFLYHNISEGDHVIYIKLYDGGYGYPSQLKFKLRFVTLENIDVVEVPAPEISISGEGVAVATVDIANAGIVHANSVSSEIDLTTIEPMLIPENIASGVSIFGVGGTYGEGGGGSDPDSGYTIYPDYTVSYGEQIEINIGTPMMSWNYISIDNGSVSEDYVLDQDTGVAISGENPGLVMFEYSTIDNPVVCRLFIFVNP